MARSKQGGTRGFLRGKVSDVLFQVTKDASGKKIQIVRSVEDGRVNPNTMLQALARMQMAACMRSLAQFKQIVDHSFEGVPYGQLSIAHFVKLNQPLVRLDCERHFDGDNDFCFPAKGDTGILCGPWVLSSGSLELPVCISVAPDYARNYEPILKISLPGRKHTFADLKSALGAAAGDYITLLAFAEGGLTLDYFFLFRRLYLAHDLANDFVISNSNVYHCFTTDGNVNFTLTYNATDNSINLKLLDDFAYSGGVYGMFAVIASKWDGVLWRRNSARFEWLSDGAKDVFDIVRPEDVFDTWFEDWNGNNPYE